MGKNSVRDNFKIFMLAVFGFFLSCSFIVILMPAIIFFAILSWSIYLISKIKYGNRITPAGGLDIIQGIESKISHPYINAIARYEGEFPIESLKKLIMEKGINYVDSRGIRPFRRYKQIREKHLGYHIFKDYDDFNINDHIKLITKEEVFDGYPDLIQSDFMLQKKLPENIKNKYGVHDTWQLILQNLMSKYGARPVPKSQPQWEILFFPESPTKTTTLFRINHSITDGIYFLRYLLEALGDKAVEYRLPYNYHQPNILKRLVEGFMAFCLVPFGIYRIATTPASNPLHGPKLTGKKIFLVTKSISLDDLKEVKLMSKASVNTVLFSCLSYALKCHFRKSNASVSHVLLLVPISLQDLSKPITTKNSFGLQGVGIPTNEIDPEKDCALVRLKEVEKWVFSAKNDPSFLPIHWLIKYISSLLPSDIVKYLLSCKGVTMVMSNVAGPQEESLYICGTEQIDMAFWVPDRDPMGLGVSVTGHRGKVRIGIMVDTGLIPTKEEAYKFLDDFLDEFKSLQKELHLSAD